MPPPGESREREKARSPDSRGLRYLRRNPDQPLPPEIQTLVTFLEEEKQRLQRKITTLEGCLKDKTIPSKAPEIRNYLGLEEKASDDDVIKAVQAKIINHKLQIAEIEQFQKLLYRHADNSNVPTIIEPLTKLYQKIFDPEPDGRPQRSPPSAAVTCGQIAEDWKTAVFKRNIRESYEQGRELLDNGLDATETSRVMTLAATGHEDAFLETYAINRDRYRELADKILSFPKEQRDQNIKILKTTLDFYNALRSKEHEKKLRKTIEASAEEARSICEGDRFKGWRGSVQKTIEKGGKYTIDHIAPLLGDKTSTARNILIWLANKGVDISKPIRTIDTQLLKGLTEDTIANLKTISAAIDYGKVAKMEKACNDLLAVPEVNLQDEDKTRFMAAFREFMPITHAFIKQVVHVTGKQIQDAYVLSRDKNSEYQRNRQEWVPAIQGRNLFRLVQIYSPFGIFLPAQAERTGDLPPVHLRSAYHQGWFKEHPYLSNAIQGVELGGEMYVGYRLLAAGVNLAARRSIIANLLKRVLRKPVKKLLPLVGEALLAYEIGSEIADYRFSAQQLKALKLLQPYDESVTEPPADVKQKVRLLILSHELGKRRKFFQSVGYDLSRLGLELQDRMWLGNYGLPGWMLDSSDYELRDSMAETGAFREAVFAANRTLVLLNFEPFTLHHREHPV